MKRSLTDTAIRNAKPHQDGKPKKYTDGGGLYLLVSPTGKHWRYDYRHHDKRKTLAIASYPEFSHSEAREKHTEARALLARGVDPSQHKRELKMADATENTFEAVSREWLARNKDGWSESHYDRSVSYLTRDVFPLLGKLHLTSSPP
jgi:hypothetical protein